LKEYGTKGSWPNIGYYPRISLGGNENYHEKPMKLLAILAEFEPGASHVHDRSVCRSNQCYLSFVSRNCTTIHFRHSYSHIKNINALIGVVAVFSLSIPPALTELCSLPKELLCFFLFYL